METTEKRAGFPPQIRYIVGNEACERFSYYGMRSILVVFMTQYLLMKDHNAEGIYHLFVSANYFLPLLGAYLSDRYLGKYNTIFWLSLVYCAGHGVLALFDGPAGLYTGLALIAIGCGGIKPCVSAFVGDQFTKSNSHLVSKVFDLFYWAINFGSTFSTLLIPWVLPKYGPSVAFGIPGVLMAIATFIFWRGRDLYVNVPPTGSQNQTHFLPIVWHAVTHLGEREKGKSWLDTALTKFPSEKVEGAKAACGVFVVFFAVSMFWSLWDQQGSTWVIQAEHMDRHFLGMNWEASQIQSVNPIFVLALIPLFSMFIYPAVEKLGIKVTPLRKMSVGMLMAGLSFVIVAVAQSFLDKGMTVNVGWQVVAFLVLTISEIMVSITGLEFAYTQAPRSMKSTIMSFWLLTVAGGNLFTAFFSWLNRFHGASAFWFYTVVMFVVSLIFIALAARYKERNYLEEAY